MSETVQCDNCGIIKTGALSLGWRHVTYESEAHALQMDTRDLDFCSWTCMSEYAQMRNRVENASPKS